MTRPLVSPVIIRPKHGLMQGAKLVAVKSNQPDGCIKCACAKGGYCLWGAQMKHGCMPGRYHYEHAEVRDDKR